MCPQRAGVQCATSHVQTRHMHVGQDTTFRLCHHAPSVAHSFSLLPCHTCPPVLKHTFPLLSHTSPHVLTHLLRCSHTLITLFSHTQASFLHWTSTQWACWLSLLWAPWPHTLCRASGPLTVRQGKGRKCRQPCTRHARCLCCVRCDVSSLPPLPCFGLQRCSVPGSHGPLI